MQYSCQLLSIANVVVVKRFSVRESQPIKLEGTKGAEIRVVALRMVDSTLSFPGFNLAIGEQLTLKGYHNSFTF